MNSRGRTCKIIFLLAAFWLFCLAAGAATYYSRQSGNWNSRFTWSTSNHDGGAAASFPTAGDIVYIAGDIVTVTNNAFCTNLIFTSGYVNGILSVNAGISLTVSGGITLQSAAGSNTSFSVSGSGQVLCSSLTAGTDINPGSNRTTQLTLEISSLNISGDILVYSNRYSSWFYSYYNNSSLVVNSGNVRVGGLIETDNENSNNTSSFSLGDGSPYLSVGGVTAFVPDGTGTSTIILNGAGATVDYFRSGTQAVFTTSYTNLTLSGSGAKTIAAAVSLSGMLSLEGTATVSGSPPSYGTASAIRYKGSAAQTTGIELIPAFSGDGGIIIDNSAGVNLASSVTIESGLDLIGGNFNVGGNTLRLNEPEITSTSGKLSATTASSRIVGGS